MRKRQTSATASNSLDRSFAEKKKFIMRKRRKNNLSATSTDSSEKKRNFIRKRQKVDTSTPSSEQSPNEKKTIKIRKRRKVDLAINGLDRSSSEKKMILRNVKRKLKSKSNELKSKVNNENLTKTNSVKKSIEPNDHNKSDENINETEENTKPLIEHTGSIDDDSFNIEKKWIDILMREYHIALKQYEKIVCVEGATAFKASLKSLKYTTHNGVIPVKFELRENPLEKDQTLAFLRTDSNAVVQRCSVIALEKIELTPTMQYWTLTEVNIIAEDEYTLSHIPFLGDAEDDTQFCSELMKTFPDGIHGTKTGCGKYINDWILFYTVKGMRKVLPDLDLKKIFHCVYDQFPNKASVHCLEEMYPDLQIRFEPQSFDRHDQTNCFGELVANFSASSLLNSYEVLVCHKCFSYDCTMHNATIDNGYNAKRKFIKTHSRDEKNLRPCSDYCFLTYKNSFQRRISGDCKQNNKLYESPNKKDFGKQLNIEVSSPSSSQKKINNYTPHEEAIFNILRTTGEDNFCKITRVFNMCSQQKRTCRELYEYACRTTPLSPRLDFVSSPVKNGKKKLDSHRTFRAVKWASTNGKVENNCMYKPCSHKGECKKENGCRCVTVENLCTKYCPCSDECQNRFPGCRCAPGNCRTRQCQCYFASWECDPDICKSCNCNKFDGCGEPICKNVSIQRGLQKRLLVAPSQVAGWGCFAQEEIDKNEFISEYCGEVISQAESERRGKIYDKIKCSYLFGLNDEQVVDATRVGNVIRFANHSCNPNCRAKVIVVNGDHKIGIFANRRINRGEELFFDYAYNKSQQVAFLSKELPKNFYNS